MEAFKVFIVNKDRELTEDSIKTFARYNLTPYKCPKHIEFREERPKTNAGKVLRWTLKVDTERRGGNDYLILTSCFKIKYPAENFRRGISLHTV
jgi:acyl-coenzyme A synthetase/AMP-(fatty) acid ligase